MTNNIKENVTIRMANIEDMASVFGLVKELAEFENAPEMVKTDVAYYEAEFHKNTFDSIVAEYDNNIIGTCIYYMTFSTWKGRCVYLEDFVVKREYRHLGVGQLLYDRFLIESKKLEATMVRWQVLHWNETAINFYEKNEATFDKEWWDCKLYFDQ